MFSSNTSAVSSDAVFVEDVFSTTLYTGNSPSTQTITNGIDLATYGGMVWCKSRNYTYNHCVMDTARGNSAGNILFTNSTLAQQSAPNAGISSYNSNGFSLRYDDGWGTNEPAGSNIASWTFRKQPKFFDVVTYTGSNSNQTISHNLGSAPGCIIIKNTTGVAGWAVYHRSLTNPNQYRLFLNTTAAEDNYGGNFIFNVTSTSFDVAGGSGFINSSGSSFVAYVFAHNAGGFGLTGTDNVISCGSFTVDSSGNATVSLGYEPQVVIVKASSTTSNWEMYDSMRGLTATSASARLYPNLSSAEGSASSTVNATSTGFNVGGNMGAGLGNETYIYIAIRRGPMKVPTSGTSVFAPNAVAGSAGDDVTTNFPVDMQIWKYRSGATNNFVVDRLRGVSTNSSFAGQALYTNLTNAEVFNDGSTLTWGSTGFRKPLASAGNDIFWNFRRAPSTFDEVCWTGNNGSNQRVNHNLGVVPELIIYKGRNKVNYWRVYYGNINKYIALNLTDAEVTGTNLWGSSAPTATDFGINCGSMDLDNFDAVAYLWATNAGVTKVGSYTGNGSSQTINCGFTSGSRMVLIIRTDASGDRYIWDSARGIVSGNDPHLSLNSTAAEVTTDDTIDTDSTGFIVNQVSATNCNVNGASYIFLSYA